MVGNCLAIGQVGKRARIKIRDWVRGYLLARACLRLGIDRYIGLPIYLANTDIDTDISVSANWISVSAYRYRLIGIGYWLSVIC